MAELLKFGFKKNELTISINKEEFNDITHILSQEKDLNLKCTVFEFNNLSVRNFIIRHVETNNISSLRHNIKIEILSYLANNTLLSISSSSMKILNKRLKSALESKEFHILFLFHFSKLALDIYAQKRQDSKIKIIKLYEKLENDKKRTIKNVRINI